ncbi:MAG: hypothetical protein EHM19_12375 [Candidatus Latescibacterota bacterium]|nr:MAG: hypothetical protein EHM19_12375 [Candidatus Latescibacterota bacterium]
MRHTLVPLALLALLALLAAVGTPTADNAPTTSNVRDPETKVLGQGGSEPFTARTGGETIETATVISGLPFEDAGTTCGYANDYDEVCPYVGSTAPDVVYRYTPAGDEIVRISVCNSYYDTKLYVYENSYTPGDPFACNDDACSGPNYPMAWLSMLENLHFQGGETYYIVIDGYGPDCGSYSLRVETYTCVVPFPPGAQLEGEPDCGPNYVDTYNGGCGSNPTIFQTLCPEPGASTAVLYGKSGTYLCNGLSYRDTDWFEVEGIGATVTATLWAEFPVLLFLIYGMDCLYPAYDFVQGYPCQEVSLSHYLGGDSYMWIWVGPSVFSGPPCGSHYVLMVENISCELPDAVEGTSWGGVKTLFR